MKRSTWMAVLVTAAVLVVAGNLPRLPLAECAASWRAGIERQVAAWPRLTRRMPVTASAARAAVQAPRPASTRPARRSLIAVAPSRLLATIATPGRVARSFAPPAWTALPPYATVPALASGLAGLIALTVLALALRRSRRSRVWQLAGRGMTLSRIASTARMPQDAVRSLLTPGLAARR